MNYYDKKQRIINLITKLFKTKLERENILNDINREFEYEVVCYECGGKIEIGCCEGCLYKIVDKLEMDNYDLEVKIDKLKNKIEELENNNG